MILWLAPPTAGAELDGRALLGGTESLDMAWYGGIDALRRNDLGSARVHLGRVVEERRRLGAANFFAMSNALLREARRVWADGRREDGLALVELAGEVAPANPRVPLVSLELRFERSGPQWSMAGDLFRALKAHTRHLGVQVMLTGRWSAATMCALYWIVFLFGVAMLMRHGRRLSHDGGHLLPKSIRGGPLALLGLAGLVVAPLSVGVGLVLMSLAWCVVLWPYLSGRERIVGILFALSVAATPLLNGTYGRALEYPGSEGEALYECFYGRCSIPAVQRLTIAASEDGFTAREGMALGLPLKRYAAADGKHLLPLYDAARQLRGALASDEGSYGAAVGLANALVVSAWRQCRETGMPVRYLEADELYQRAQGLSDDPIEAEYNRSILLSWAGRPEDSRELLQQARSRDNRRISPTWLQYQALGEKPCPDGFNANIHLLDVVPPMDELLPGTRDRIAAGSGPILLPMRYLMAGIVDGSFMVIVGLTCALILLVGAVIVRKMRPAFHCVECQTVACGRCRRELRDLHICEDCLFRRIKGGFMSSRDKWLLDRGVELSRDRRRTVGRWLTFVAPGFGHLLMGRTFRGAIFLSLILVGACYAWLGEWLLPDPALAGATGAMTRALAIGQVGIVYVVAVLDALASRRD